MRNEDGGTIFLIGLVLGFMIMGLFAWNLTTHNSRVTSGKQFILNNAVYQCAVINKLEPKP